MKRKLNKYDEYYRNNILSNIIRNIIIIIIINLN